MIGVFLCYRYLLAIYGVEWTVVLLLDDIERIYDNERCVGIFLVLFWRSFHFQTICFRCNEDLTILYYESVYELFFCIKQAKPTKCRVVSYARETGCKYVGKSIRTRLSTVGERAFPVAASRLWNTLPPRNAKVSDWGFTFESVMHGWDSNPETGTSDHARCSSLTHKPDSA